MFLWLCGARCPRYNPVSLCTGGDVYFGVLILDIASFSADSWTPRNPGSSPLCKAICHVSCSHSHPKPSSLPGFKPNLSTSRFDRLHCNAGCRKRVTWEAYWIETGPTLLGSNAELWLQGPWTWPRWSSKKNVHESGKVWCSIQAKKVEGKFHDNSETIHSIETADVCWVFVLTSKTGSSRELNADECVLETEVTNLGALGLYRNLTNLAEQKSCCFYLCIYALAFVYCIFAVFRCLFQFVSQDAKEGRYTSGLYWFGGFQCFLRNFDAWTSQCHTEFVPTEV